MTRSDSDTSSVRRPILSTNSPHAVTEPREKQCPPSTWSRLSSARTHQDTKRRHRLFSDMVLDPYRRASVLDGLGQSVSRRAAGASREGGRLLERIVFR
jgi:hypothetical protein